MKYTLEQIKKAFWGTFHECGELWFSYLGSDKENHSHTETEWEYFLEELKKTEL